MHRTREAWLEESHQAGDESLELSGKGKTEVRAASKALTRKPQEERKALPQGTIY